MSPKFVFIVLIVACGVAVALATATTIRQVDTAASSISHPSHGFKRLS
jgi:hypothetical protein